MFFLLCLPAAAVADGTEGTAGTEGSGLPGNIHLGQLQIHPYLSETETFNDNIYATPNDTKSDMITTTNPGIKLMMPFSTHEVDAEYQAVFKNYADYSAEDTVDQYASVKGKFKFADLYGLNISDNYENGHIPRAESAVGEIEGYDKNAAALSASYIFADRFQVQTGYTQTNWNYSLDYDKYRNRDEELISTYLYYRFLPKTSAFIEYDFNNIIYEQKLDGLDNLVQTPFLGVKWEFSDRTNGTVKVGFLHKEFEASDKSNVDTWSASVDVHHAFTETSSIQVKGLRDVNESNFNGTSYFITTGAFAEYTLKLFYKLSALARFSYGEDDYSNAVAPYPDRHDQTTLAGVGLGYQMKDWLAFVLNYNHLVRDSNIDTWNLTDNTISLTVKFAL